MNYFRWLPICLLVLSANANALQSKIEIIEQFDNLRMVAFVDKKAINESPEWNPNNDPPPLTIVEAIQAVKQFNKGPKKLGAIKEIEIRPVPNDEKHWHYLIKITNDLMKSKYSIYVVLMSGKVVPAIIEPQAIK